MWPLIGVAALVAAVVDLRRGAVPYWVSGSTLAVALGARLALEGPGSADGGLVSGLLGSLACAAPFAVLALLGSRVGWRDVSLLAAVGAGFGVPRALAAVMLISVAGAVAALVFVLRRRLRSGSVPKGVSGAAPRDAVDSARSIPYGVPIAVGVLWAMLWAGPAVPDVEEAPQVEVEESDGGVPAGGAERPEVE